MQPKKLKRIVIKEELVALTGDYIKAIILGQFIYWSERVNDFDQFIKEERARAENINIEPRNGWIYKSSEELSDETMLHISPATILRHIKVLLENKWLEVRTNPEHKWDRTKQYRVNLYIINNDLIEIGYVLQDYKVDIVKATSSEIKDAFFKMKNGVSKNKNASSKKQKASQNAFFKMKNGTFKIKNGSLIFKNRAFKNQNRTVQDKKAIPETTTEITTEITTKTFNNVVVNSTDKNNFEQTKRPRIDVTAWLNEKGLTQSDKIHRLQDQFTDEYIQEKIKVVENSYVSKDSDYYTEYVYNVCLHDWKFTPDNQLASFSKDIAKRIDEATGLYDETFAQQLLKHFPNEYVRYQLERVVKKSKISQSVTGFIYNACQNVYPEPIKVTKTNKAEKSNKRVVHKKPNSSKEKKELIQSLYMS